MKIIGKFLLIMCIPLVFSGISVEAMVDKKTIQIDETLSLVIKIRSDQYMNIPQFNLPKLSDFDVMGSFRSYKKSIVNGKVDNVLESSFSLVPKKLGRSVIPALTMKFKKKTLSTQEILIEVLKNKQINANGPDLSKKSYPKVFAEAASDKKVYYLGEPIIYTLRFYTAVSFFNGPSLRDASNKNLTKAHDIETQQRTFTKSLGGRQYNVTELKSVYYPLQAGNAMFGRTAVVYSFSPFERNKQAKTMDKPIQIMDLPQNNNYNYAVGDFDLSATLSKATISVNDGVYLTITIEGNGNLQEAIMQKLDFNSDLESFDPKVNIIETFKSDRIFAQKTFEYLLVPRMTGEYQIPEIAFSYFNPISKKYVAKKTKAILLKVTPAQGRINSDSIHLLSIKNDVNEESLDIRYIKDGMGPEYSLSSQRIKLLFIAISLVLLFLILFGSMIRNAFIQLFVSSSDRLFLKRIKNIRKRPSAFYADSHYALLEYISNKQSMKIGELGTVYMQKIFKGNDVILADLKFFEERRFVPGQEIDDLGISRDYNRLLSAYKDIRRALK